MSPLEQLRFEVAKFHTTIDLLNENIRKSKKEDKH